MPVARLRDSAGAALGARGICARHSSEDAHQLSGVIKTGDVTQFGENPNGAEHIKATQTDERLQHRRRLRRQSDRNRDHAVAKLTAG